MSFYELAHSFSWRPLCGGLASPLFWFCCCLGFGGLLFPAPAFPAGLKAWFWFLAAPFVEELTWRALLQNELAKCSRRTCRHGIANALASLAFAAAHFAVSPCLMAMLTFFPSLALGALWARFQSTWLCGLVHLWYNVALRL